MRSTSITGVVALSVAAACCGVPLAGQTPQVATPRQTEEDEYTRYELLDAGTAQFRITYDVTATTPGARFYFNPIRRGSEASDESVIDLMTGASLRFEIVPGKQARLEGHPTADTLTSYIKVQLPRAVPPGGEVRLMILKTYRDPLSYRVEGNRVVFERSLGIRRNAVVLPRGYELVECNVPSQVLSEPDGRVTVSFMNPGPGAVALVLRGRRLPS
ncbi:MAG: hypothetical protein HY337_09990 [Gemmatimonadetes bacterium]|nr:hypothetical protein [Gemmatimonadota bacterium]